MHLDGKHVSADVELGLLEQELFIKAIGAGDLMFDRGSLVKEWGGSVDAPASDLFTIDVGHEGIIVAHSKLQPGLGQLSGDIEFDAHVDGDVVVGHVIENGGIIFISVADAARAALPAGLLRVEFKVDPGLRRRGDGPEEAPGVSFPDQGALRVEAGVRDKQQHADWNAIEDELCDGHGILP